MDKWGAAVSGATTGVTLGATIGSAFPGLGTVIGGAAGLIIGGVGGYLFGDSSEQTEAKLWDNISQIDVDTNAPIPMIGKRTGAYSTFKRKVTKGLNAEMADKLKKIDNTFNTITGVSSAVSGIGSIAVDSGLKIGTGWGKSTTVKPKLEIAGGLVDMNLNTFENQNQLDYPLRNKPKSWNIATSPDPYQLPSWAGGESSIMGTPNFELRKGGTNSGGAERVEAEGGEIDVEFDENYNIKTSTPILGASHESGGVARVLPKNHAILNKQQQQRLANGEPLYNIIQSLPDVNDDNDDMAQDGKTNLTGEDSLYQGLKPRPKLGANVAMPKTPTITDPSFAYRQKVSEIKRKMLEEKKNPGSTNINIPGITPKPKPPKEGHGFTSGIADFISDPGKYTYKVATALDLLVNPPGPVKVPAGYSYDSKTNKVYPIGTIKVNPPIDTTPSVATIPPVNVNPVQPVANANTTKPGDFGGTRSKLGDIGARMGWPTGLGVLKTYDPPTKRDEVTHETEQQKSFFKRLIDKFGNMDPADYTLMANEVGNLLSMLQGDPDKINIPDTKVGDTIMYNPKHLTPEPYLNNLNRSYNSLLNFYKQTGKDTTGLTSWLKDSTQKILEGVEGKNAEMEANAVQINTQAENSRVGTQAQVDSRTTELRTNADMKWLELVGAKDVARSQAVAKSIYDIGQHKQAKEDQAFSDYMRAKLMGLSWGGGK